MEIIVRSFDYGYTVNEVPIVFVDRIYGESKIEGAEITKFLKSVWKLFSIFWSNFYKLKIDVKLNLYKKYK